LSGSSMAWIKTALTGTLYPNGFTNMIVLKGSKYLVPNVLERAIQLTPEGINGVYGRGYLVLAQEGNLVSAVTVSNIVLDPMPANKFTVPTELTNNTLSLKLSPPTFLTGVVKGTFKHPANGGVPVTKITGVILQVQNEADGFFNGPTESGSFQLLGQ
jgi:hypothetical protein